MPEEDARKFAHQNDLLYYETSSFWNRDDDEEDTGMPGRGGIGVLIDSMVEEIVEDIITDRQEFHTQGRQNSPLGISSPMYKDGSDMFNSSNPYAHRGGGVRLG